ncbi:MAG: Eco57I restriction-modification methylase domain-containing protein [Candidatus Hodarchaeales archaeon]|jgi:hypothetical protein
MKSNFEEFYSLYRKARRYLLQNINGIRDEERKKEFINNFMLQMLILWYVQEREFFDNDKNYFVTKFREIQTNKSLNGLNDYFEFLINFLEKINIHLDRKYFLDEILGKIVVPAPAIFFKINTDVKKITVPNECFYNERKTDLSTIKSPKKGSSDLPLLNFFEHKINKFNGFILSEIYVKLITQMEKKKSGAYYTPETITYHLCKTTIESCLIEKINKFFNLKFYTIDSIIESSKKRVLKQLLMQLQSLKILDPAVGTAHFLESAIKILTEIYVKIWRVGKKIGLKKGIEVIMADKDGNLRAINLLEISDENEFKLSVISYFILSKNIYGVDTNPAVLKIAKARLFLLWIKYFDINKNYPINTPKPYFNLKEGNSLLGYIRFVKDNSVKQLKLESYFNEITSTPLLELINVNSELLEYLQEAAKALNIDGALVKEVEELNLIFSQKEISQINVKTVLSAKEKLTQVLLSSLNTNFSKPLRNLLIRITDLVNAKLDEKFSKENSIDLSRLNEVKTFHWICEFPNVFLKEGGFNVLIANPPYLGESGNKELFRIHAKALRKYYEGKMDLWYFFLHRSLDLMVDCSYSSFVTSSYWVTASGATKLRARLLLDTFIVQYIDFAENKVFNTAQGVHTNIISFKKLTEPNDNIRCTIFNKTYPQGVDPFLKLKDQLNFKTDQKKLTFENWDLYIHFLPKNLRSIIEYITENSITLKTSGYYVKEGIVSGLNKITKRQIKKYKLPNEWAGVGVFILNKENPQDLKVIESLSQEEKSHLKDFYKNSDISRYYPSIKTQKNILYLNRNTVNLEKLPKIKMHIQKFKEILKRSLDNPPYINRPRTQSIFTSPKIITPQRSVRNIFAYISFDWYAGQDVYYILNDKNDKEKLKSLLLILNSKFAYFWLYWMGKRKGKHLELFGEPLGFFPIPYDLHKFPILSNISDYILFLLSIKSKRIRFQQIIIYFKEQIADTLVFELYFKERLQRNGAYQSEKPSLLEHLSKKLKNIEYDQWAKLHYKEQLEKGLSDNEKFEKETLENESMNIIEESYTSLKQSKQVWKLLTQIRANNFVKTIDEII